MSRNQDTGPLRIYSNYGTLPLNLRFVRRRNNLRDYECSLPFLIHENVIYTRIGIIKAYMKNKGISDEEERMEKEAQEVGGCERCLDMLEDRLHNMILFEKEESIIWGETKDVFKRIPCIERWECIRVPKKDIDTLRKCIDKPISVFTESSPEMEETIASIIAEVHQLEQHREHLIKELQDSLYCKIFLGDCKYLGRRLN